VELRSGGDTVGSEVKPADVYAAVHTLQWLIIGLAALIVVQIGVKIVIFSRVIALMKRVDRMMRITEMHANLTESQRERVAKTLSKASEDVKHAVEEVPEKAADKTVEKLKGFIPGEPPDRSRP
jgi:hypothetical protein